MAEVENDIIDLNLNPLHRAIGEAIEAYAEVETILTSLLQALLRTDCNKAHALFFAIQNIRSRNELFETLLQLEFKGALKKYWASCGSYLYKLALFRNAVAHWHPLVVITVKSETDLTGVGAQHALHHPAYASFKELTLDHFPPFLTDCVYIRRELSALHGIVGKQPDTLPEKFRRPIARRNLAVLQLHHSAKTPQPQRPPSRPKAAPKGQKLSAKQRRLRALGISTRSKGKPA